LIRATRRELLIGSTLVPLGSALPFAAAAQAPAATAPDLFVGTGGHGHTFPGATLPFGMVQLSPDTNNAGWDACSGYHQSDRSIMGFSHTHLSGTGIGDMLDVLVVPTRGPLKLVAGTTADPSAGYRQRYSDEHAEPGYYRVKLESGVIAELTATERTGQHRYTFPAGPAHILIDFAHCKQETHEELIRIEDASLAIDADGTLTGSRQVFRWAEGGASISRCSFPASPTAWSSLATMMLRLPPARRACRATV
jgi:putative alpha-1,2-mannosidase